MLGRVIIKIQKLGGLIGVSPQHIILRAAEKITFGNLPRLRSEVVTEDMSRVGTIADIFGPHLMPFISVRPESKETLESIKTKPRGTTLYILKSPPPSSKPRRNERNAPNTRSNKFKKPIGE